MFVPAAAVSAVDVTAFPAPFSIPYHVCSAHRCHCCCCRAEAVGIYLCVYPEVLKIFGHPVDGAYTHTCTHTRTYAQVQMTAFGMACHHIPQFTTASHPCQPFPSENPQIRSRTCIRAGGDGLDIVYVNWLNMARAGLLALQYYTPATKQWGQAHMQARYALLRVMLEAGQGFVEIKGMAALAAGGCEDDGQCRDTCALACRAWMHGQQTGKKYIGLMRCTSTAPHHVLITVVITPTHLYTPLLLLPQPPTPSRWRRAKQACTSRWTGPRS